MHKHRSGDEQTVAIPREPADRQAPGFRSRSGSSVPISRTRSSRSIETLASD